MRWTRVTWDPIRPFAALCAAAIVLLWSACPLLAAEPPQGQYFAKKEYAPKPLPRYALTKDQLPSPIFDENPLYLRMYWKTWELAFRNFYEPKPGSGFVSQFIDAAFNQNIFLWDTCFLTMFCNYGHSLVPGIGSLDNFYAKQYEDGEICREIDRTTGRDYVEWINAQNQDLFSRWGRFSVTYVGRDIPKPPPHVTLDALNHPILAWAELESFRVTGDRSRLGLIYEPLARYYRALQKYIRQGDGLYMTDWASMDNSPRNAHIAKGGTAVDTSSQMVLFADHLAQIADMLGKKDDAAGFRQEAAELGHLINQKMWNPQRRFYFDLTVEGKQSPAKTIAAYWTLLAGVASEQQAEDLAAELHNPQSFGRKHRVPTTPVDQAGFDPAGGYWCGAVWSPTNTMVIRGLQRYGMKDLAHELAMEHLRAAGEVFQATGTVWENYAPDAPKPGKPAKPDFVGWTGIVPIMYFMEFAIGLRPDAAANRLNWALKSSGRCGCERFRFNGHVVTLVAEAAPGQAGPRRVNVESDGDFHLRIDYAEKQMELAVKKGKNVFVLQ